MGIQEAFCPKCGGPTEGGLCNRCRAEAVSWFICEPRVTCVHCPTCGSIKHGNVWSDSPLERDAIASECALSAAHVHEDVAHISIEIKPREVSPNRMDCRVDVSGSLYGVSVSDSCVVEVVWKKEQCDRCSRYSGGYYEGIIQFRAMNRKPDPFEIEQASEIAYRLEDELQEGGERLAFISRFDETRDGLDITVGSHHFGQLLARELVSELGGRFTTHPKLVGEKDGKKIYRITFSIRLPCFQKGDVIAREGRYFEVREMDPQNMKVFDLRDGILRTVPYDCTERKIGNVRDALDALVAYIDGDTAGILDPETYETREQRIPVWLPLTEGMHVRILRDFGEESVIMVG